MTEDIIKFLEHQNFAGIDPATKTPFFMSILVEEEQDSNRVCRAILWTPQVSFLFSFFSSNKSFWDFFQFFKEIQQVVVV